MKPHQLYIRADAGSTMGTGHIMRCIALAQAWQQCGGSVCFITHGTCPVLLSRILDEGFELKLISTQSPDQKDISQTLQFLDNHARNKKDRKAAHVWVVLDGYHFSPEYQKTIQKAGYRLLVLDDHNHLPGYYADLLLNQNPAALRYAYQCSDDTQKLLGTDYTLIRKEFLSKNPETRSAPQKATRILVTLGGADPGNITPLIIRAIQNLNDPDIETRVVVGPSNPRYDVLKSAERTKKTRIRLIQDPAMPDLMEWADLTVTAGGSTCWELCFMGVPFVVIPVAPNQVDIAACLEKDTGAVNAGPINTLTAKNMTKILTDLIISPHKREQMSALGKNLVDGTGPKRILRQMLPDMIQMRSENPIGHHTKSITLISDENSWINPYLFQLIDQILLRGHGVKWVHHICSITASDIVFYLGCGQLAPKKTLGLNKHNIIVHGSALPQGKGWSPISWQILEGRNTIPLTLFEAAPKVDSGPIYLQKNMIFKGHELIDEIREKTAGYTIDMCLDFLKNHQSLALAAKDQQGKESFYPKRTPKDSRLDPDKLLRKQFNLFRIADNQNYPVFFRLKGVTYKLAISKMETPPDED